MVEGSARPHALYVAWGFPPSRGGGVFRALATANGLVEAGFDVTVLTADRETFFRFTGVDEALEARVDPSIDVVRLPFSWPRLEWDLRRWSKERVLDPSGWLDRWQARVAQGFPEGNYAEWAEPLVQKAFEVHARRPVDVTVATVNPNVDAYAAFRLHEAHGVPYVVDQRDAWTLAQFTGERAYPLDSREVEWERRLFEGAAEVWLVNDAMREWHAEQYPSVGPRMRVVMNGWDSDLVSPAPAYDGHRALRFGYIGTVTPQVPLQEFLDGWHLAAADPAMADVSGVIHGHLGFYRHPNATMVEQIETGAADRLSYGGAVSKTEIASTYASMDVLMMLLGGGRYVTSGKVFEYVATGLPVVSVHPVDTGCVEVLRDYPLWFPAASLEPHDVAAALTAAARRVRETGPAERAAAVDHAQRYRRERQLEPALAAVRRIAGLPEAAS